MHLQLIGLSDEEIRRVKIRAARKKVNFQTVAQHEADSNRGKLKFGCRSLDCIIRNGLNSGITEISGESGAGKTQICLQLSLMVQLCVEQGGLDKGAVFICTEDAFPSKRLFQMADVFTKRYGNKSYLDNIFIEHVHDSEHLVECVLSRLPYLMRQKPIGLIVIDSVAGVFRLESNAISRANDMRKFAHGLQTISTEYRCAVVCVNQVRRIDQKIIRKLICILAIILKVTSRQSINDDSKASAKSIPSLGLAWSTLVTTRLEINKTHNNYTILSINQAGKILEKYIPIRECSVIFSPELPKASTTFMITADGIVGD